MRLKLSLNISFQNRLLNVIVDLTILKYATVACKIGGELVPLGKLVIPIKGGQKVKGAYLAALATAIEIISEEDDEGGVQ